MFLRFCRLSLKSKEQEDNEVIINDLQNKFSGFRNEINLIIDGSQKYSEEMITGKLETYQEMLKTEELILVKEIAEVLLRRNLSFC